MNYSEIYFKNFLGYTILGFVVASFIGSIVSMIWLFFSKRTTKFYIQDSMKYLRLILLCFVLPAVPFVIYPIGSNISNDTCINLNNPMLKQLTLLIEIWLLFICILSLRRLIHYYRMCKISKESIPIEDEEILSRLEHWAGVLGIQKDVKIRSNANIYSPAILYHRGYQILLPSFDMTKHQLEIALLHELVHLKNKDIITKDFCFFVQVLHGWNPLVYFLKKNVIKWAEVVCDLTACELGMNLFSEKNYYRTIVEMMEQAKEQRNSDSMCCFFEEETMLRFRINKFRLAKNTKQNGRKRVFATSVILVLCLCTFVSVMMQQGIYVWHEKTLTGFVQETQKKETYKEKNGEAIFLNVAKQYSDVHNLEEPLDDKKVLDKNELWEIELTSDNMDRLDMYIFTESKSYVVGYKTQDGIRYFDASKTKVYAFDDEKIESIFIKNQGKEEEFDIAAIACE